MLKQDLRSDDQDIPNKHRFPNSRYLKFLRAVLIYSRTIIRFLSVIALVLIINIVAVLVFEPFTGFQNIILLWFATQYPLPSIVISITIFLLLGLNRFANSQLRKAKDEDSLPSWLKALTSKSSQGLAANDLIDVSTLPAWLQDENALPWRPASSKEPIPPEQPQNDRDRQIDLIKNWIERDTTLKEELKFLLATDQDAKQPSYQNDINYHFRNIEERLLLLEKQLTERDFQKESRMSLSDWISALDNTANIIVAIPAIIAIIVSVIALFHIR